MSDTDSLVFEALNLLTNRLRAGEEIQLEQVLSNYPELSDEIRSLWGTILVAEQLGLPAIDSSVASSAALPRETPAAPGRIGKFELIQEIGRGGMGVVYKAFQRNPNRVVAVKMLLRGDLSTPENLARFQAEGEAAARLDHPHIVAIHDVGTDQGQPYFSMPFIDGTTLAKRISESTLPDREAAELMIPVCRAIAYAHQRGILHRDLKPSNILIDQNGHQFVSDFGLAKRMDPEDVSLTGAALTETGAILGTPGYMAPEQAAGNRGTAGPATDVYSLGAILYACVTGRAPFQAANPVDAILMILEQDPPPPRLLHPQIDIDLEMIILKALQKPIDLRYQTADALADDLEAYLRHEPISARSSKFTQILSRAFRPTHNIGVLENWGLLWMLHAAVIVSLCIITDVMRFQGVTSRLPYVGLWTLGLGTWAMIFWNLRRRAGPVTFVERQIAHVWAASMGCSTALFGVEWLMGLPVLALSPVLGLFAGAVFIAKAGILSGEFYIPGILLYLSAIPMALFPEYSLTIFGIVSGGAFFLSGLKFHLLQRANHVRSRM
ncbi:serine/threonine-protein kinase [Planctomicrobium sp. SH661]|uniref:serine/threonine-protein kinase n=1 Tax=Planctomicrobium sp. SH661 TaxID=3448124 RepID=UPI003F5C01A1